MIEKSAPLFVHSFELCTWLLEHFDAAPGALPRRLCEGSLDLIEALSLALRGLDRGLNIDRADQLLFTLRIHLRMAAALDLLDDEQLLFALGCCDDLGRQLGGWRRALGPI
ncbi:MAG: hypothetical protein H6739_14515 [Alphaproteobacteria bacterium]|nr:hypothetical protein [Alphaproteobacteria bacterium]